MPEEVDVQPVTLQARFQQMIQMDRRNLTLGAYGDEGGILLRVEECLCKVQDDSLGAKYAQGLVRPLDAFTPKGAESMEDLVRQTISTWVPLRWRMDNGEAFGKLNLVSTAFRIIRLRRKDNADLDRNLALESKITRAIESRDVFTVERGGAEWTLLRSLDLLMPLAPFMVEM